MISLKRMSRELCHEFFQKFENASAVFDDLTSASVSAYHYDSEKVEQYFERQRMC